MEQLIRNSTHGLLSIWTLIFLLLLLGLVDTLSASDWELIDKKTIRKLRPAVYDIEPGSRVYSKIRFTNESGSPLEIVKIKIYYTDGSEDSMEIGKTLNKGQDLILDPESIRKKGSVSKVVVSCRSVNRSLLAAYGGRD